MIRHLVVTGGTGYLGRHLREAALSSGMGVTLLSRTAVTEKVSRRLWKLGEPIPGDALDPCVPPGGHALVHLAHDWSDTCADGVNVSGTRVLLESARACGIGRFVLASTQSARPDAPNAYGRMKHRQEGLLTGSSEVAARIGLVYGGTPDGMYALLLRLVGLAPVLPMVEPWRLVQPIHVREAATGLLCLSRGTGGGWQGLASPVGVEFGSFLRTLAREAYGRSIVVLPVPLWMALAGCAVVSRLPFLPDVDRERVLGLSGTLPMECREHLQALGLAVSPADAALRGEFGMDDPLVAEGAVLLRYLLGKRPSFGLARRYAAVAAAAGATRPLGLGWMARRCPAMLRLREPFGDSSETGRRLRLAGAIAETSAQGEELLSGGGIGSLVREAVLDAFALPFRLLRHLAE